jgi:hypothetical protein
LKYIRAEPALTLRLAKAAIDAAKALKKKSAVTAAGVAVVGAEGQIGGSSGDGGVVAFTPVSSTSTSASKGSGIAVVGAAGGAVVGGVEKAPAQGIDWGLVIAEGEKAGDITGDATLFDRNVQVKDSKENTELNVVEQEEGEENDEEDEEDEEDNVDSTEFDEVIEVEDVFGKEIAERETENRRINSIEEGEEGEENEENESEDEETDDSEEESDDDNTVTKTTAVPVSAVPAQTGDINFSEDFFPVLSAEGPKRAKKVWPAPTNENIDRTPVTATAVVSGSGSDGTIPVGDAVEGVEGTKSAVWGAGTESGGAGQVVKNWSQVAALSVKAAVETATDNSHTMTNRYCTSIGS